MLKSANPNLTAADQRRLARRLQIQDAALELVMQHGYDGFTMDDLAEAAGVSRRTLFNHVADKESSVLGPMEEDEDIPVVAEFRAGGPTGDLMQDLVITAQRIMDEAQEEDTCAVERHLRVEDAMRRDPKLMALVDARFARFTALAAEAICARQQWPDDDLRARAIATALLALIRLSLEKLRDRPDNPGLGDAFREVIAAFNDCADIAHPPPA